MSTTISSKIYKSRKTIIEYLENQKYDVSGYKEFNENEVDAMFNNSELDMLVELMPNEEENKKNDDENISFELKQYLEKYKEKSKKIYVKYYVSLKNNNKQIKKLVLDQIIEDLYFADIPALDTDDTLIIIIDDEPNQTIIDEIKHLYESKQIFIIIFNMEDLQSNTLEHEYVPPMKILDRENIKKLIQQYNINPKHVDQKIPEANRFDAQVKAIFLKPGQICSIERKSKTSLTYLFYRICLN